MRRALAVGGTAVLATGLSLAAINVSATAQPSPQPVTAAKATELAQAGLSAHRSDVFASSDDAYTVKRVINDDNGASHVRYTRTFKGLAVLGGDFVIHTKPDGSYDGASVAQAAPLSLDTKPSVSSADAAVAARKAFSGKVAKVGSPKLVVDILGGTGKLAWETVVEGAKPDRTPSKLHVFTDAKSGAVLDTEDDVEAVTGTGKGITTGSVSLDTTQSGSSYQLRDPSHGNGYACDAANGTTNCTLFTDSDNKWGNGKNSDRASAGVDAAYGAATTFDYYKKTFKRNGIFGDGQGVPSIVHFDDGWANAVWDGTQMIYGDGIGNARPVIALDVSGHEMTHGITQELSGLEYKGESGGLNEATSDIFGTMVEFYAKNSTDAGDYKIGEKVNLNGDGKPLRYMYNPKLDGASDTCWSTGTKNKNVHYSSGVANHTFFMLAEGSGKTTYGTSPVCGGAKAVKGLGRAAAAKIWYRALNVYFTSTTLYVDSSSSDNTARHYTLRAALDLYGKCSTAYKAVQAAWSAAGVAGKDKACS
jgi:Zn-dependent metalloprotease